MGGASTDSPQCTVIICHHTGRLIERCLSSVFASQGISYEVVVVTSDPTWHPPDARLRYYFVEDGPAHKRNVGARDSRSPYLVFLDDDVEISPSCLYEFWRFLDDHPKCGMAFAKIYKMEEGRRDEFDDCGSWFTRSGFLFARSGNGQVDRGQFDQPVQCLSSKSATCAIRNRAFLDVAGFDRDYFILGEETDVAWRMWLKAWEIWYVPTAVSWHAFGCESLKPRADYYTIQRTMRYGCRNYLRLLTTNLGMVRLLRTLPCHLLMWTVAAVGFLTRGDMARAGAISQGIADYLITLPATCQKRHRVQRTRLLSDRTLLPLVSHAAPLSYYLNRLGRYWTTQLHG